MADPDQSDGKNARSRIMRAIRKKNTGPELVVRRALHGMGFRFRLHRPDLPGSPDIVLPRHRSVILVHGCFWHQHAGCRHATLPRTRPEYWLPKLARNAQRDAQAEAALVARGWRILVLWECEVGDRNVLRARLSGFLLGSEQVK
ncbi:MAG: DNA mismatch endonuclease Vsr [Methylocystis sp.]|nr:DNA mismatch endonuclease Vsr [Methylocystis sp.]